MDLPKFSGGDPEEWICAMEGYFCKFQIELRQSAMNFASEYLVGDARRWFDDNQHKFATMGWCGLVYHLIWEFEQSKVPADETPSASLNMTEDEASFQAANNESMVNTLENDVDAIQSSTHSNMLQYSSATSQMSSIFSSPPATGYDLSPPRVFWGSPLIRYYPYDSARKLFDELLQKEVHYFCMGISISSAVTLWQIAWGALFATLQEEKGDFLLLVLNPRPELQLNSDRECLVEAHLGTSWFTASFAHSFALSEGRCSRTLCVFRASISESTVVLSSTTVKTTLWSEMNTSRDIEFRSDKVSDPNLFILHLGPSPYLLRVVWSFDPGIYQGGFAAKRLLPQCLLEEAIFSFEACCYGNRFTVCIPDSQVAVSCCASKDMCIVLKVQTFGRLNWSSKYSAQFRNGGKTNEQGKHFHLSGLVMLEYVYKLYVLLACKVNQHWIPSIESVVGQQNIRCMSFDRVPIAPSTTTASDPLLEVLVMFSKGCFVECLKKSGYLTCLSIKMSMRFNMCFDPGIWTSVSTKLQEFFFEILPMGGGVSKCAMLPVATIRVGNAQVLTAQVLINGLGSNLHCNIWYSGYAVHIQKPGWPHTIRHQKLVGVLTDAANKVVIFLYFMFKDARCLIFWYNALLFFNSIKQAQYISSHTKRFAECVALSAASQCSNTVKIIIWGAKRHVRKSIYVCLAAKDVSLILLVDCQKGVVISLLPVLLRNLMRPTAISLFRRPKENSVLYLCVDTSNLETLAYTNTFFDATARSSLIELMADAFIIKISLVMTQRSREFQVLSRCDRNEQWCTQKKTILADAITRKDDVASYHHLLDIHNLKSTRGRGCIIYSDNGGLLCVSCVFTACYFSFKGTLWSMHLCHQELFYALISFKWGTFHIFLNSNTAVNVAGCFRSALLTVNDARIDAQSPEPEGIDDSLLMLVQRESIAFFHWSFPILWFRYWIRGIDSSLTVVFLLQYIFAYEPGTLWLFYSEIFFWWRSLLRVESVIEFSEPAYCPSTTTFSSQGIMKRSFEEVEPHYLSVWLDGLSKTKHLRIFFTTESFGTRCLHYGESGEATVIDSTVSNVVILKLSSLNPLSLVSSLQLIVQSKGLGCRLIQVQDLGMQGGNSPASTSQDFRPSARVFQPISMLSVSIPGFQAMSIVWVPLSHTLWVFLCALLHVGGAKIANFLWRIAWVPATSYYAAVSISMH